METFEMKAAKAIVRIHGTYDADKLKEATVDFMKRAEAQKKKRSEKDV